MKSRTITVWRLNRTGYVGVKAKLLFLCVTVFLCRTQSVAAQTPIDAGQVQGTAFIQDSTGQSFIANAKVTLQGMTLTMGTQTDENGKFEFRSVRPGTYSIEAVTSGLLATQVVTVEAGEAAEISLELKPTIVQESVTVT